MVSKVLTRRSMKSLAGNTLGRLRVLQSGPNELTVFTLHSTPTESIENFKALVEEVGVLYHWLSPDDITDFFAHPEWYRAGPYALFTFDDGYRNNLLAAEYLAQRGIRAVFFIATGFVASQDPWDYYATRILKAPPTQPANEAWRRRVLPMAAADVQDLVSFGHDVGSHTVSHRKLWLLSHDEVESELRTSAEMLLNWTGRRPTLFAAPFSSVPLSADVWELIRAHYDVVFGTEDCSNRRWGGPGEVFRTNVESYWDTGRIRYATRVRLPEFWRWSRARQQRLTP